MVSGKKKTRCISADLYAGSGRQLAPTLGSITKWVLPNLEVTSHNDHNDNKVLT